MKKDKIIKKINIIYFLIWMMSVCITYGQTNIDFDAFSFSGYEYNVFKSPENLLDLTTNNYLKKEQLLVSDNFLDFGYDAEIEVSGKKKYNFKAFSDFLYRGYFNYSNLNQKDFSMGASYERYLMRNLIAGTEYEFKWKDKLGTTVTGEELIRSFKYFSNNGEIYLKYLFNNDLEFLFSGSYEYKNYYDDNSLMPLDNSIIGFDLRTDYELSRKHRFHLDLKFTNKQYKHIPALDRSGSEVIKYDNSGNVIPGYTLRELNYYDFELAYDLKAIRGLLISPGFSLTKRSDIYDDYYSYTSFSPELKVRYMNYRWYIANKIAYKNTSYNERFAYTDVEGTELLTYSYIKYDLKARYKLSRPFELYLNFSSDSRDSNSELDYKKTRRPYLNYELYFGVNAAFSLKKPNIFD